MNYDDPNTAPGYLPENAGKSAAEVATEGANESTPTGAKNYERLEALTGGLMDYISPEDQVLFPDMHHPNAALAVFIDAVLGYGGSALGIASAYTKMKADKSYTAFRGDMIMTWVTFLWLQKWLERRFCDWVGVKALNWAMRTKAIKALPEKWERSISWTWPIMPEVNVDQAEKAIATALKNGTTDFAKLLGPDWKAKLAAYAEQLDEARALGIPLSVFETKSGGEAVTPTADGTDEEDEEKDETT